MSEGMKLALLGGGAMGEAILKGVMASGTAKGGRIIVAEPRPERRTELEAEHGVQTTASNAEAVAGATLIILAVKPQALSIALSETKGRMPSDAILLSIVAGAPCKRIAELGGHDRIVRCMPNTPAQVGAGMTGWFASFPLSERESALVKAVLSSLGEEVQFAEEEALDKVTALSGSGPAYMYLFAEALVDAAVRIGLPRDISTKLVRATLSGSAEYWKRSGLHPAVLRNQVTSPGGTTAAALHAFEAAGLRAAAEDAVQAAYERARELGRA